MNIHNSHNLNCFATIITDRWKNSTTLPTCTPFSLSSACIASYTWTCKSTSSISTYSIDVTAVWAWTTLINIWRGKIGKLENAENARKQTCSNCSWLMRKTLQNPLNVIFVCKKAQKKISSALLRFSAHHMTCTNKEARQKKQWIVTSVLELQFTQMLSFSNIKDERVWAGFDQYRKKELCYTHLDSSQTFQFQCIHYDIDKDRMSLYWYKQHWRHSYGFSHYIHGYLGERTSFIDFCWPTSAAHMYRAHRKDC